MLSADILLPFLLFLGAALYTSVGHAGASAYLAAMALFGLAPDVMRPTALVLNIIVASLSAVRFARAGLIEPKLLVALVAGSAPLAFIGGGLALPGHWYRPLVGLVLMVAGLRLLWPGGIRVPEAEETKRPWWPFATGTGATVGFLSGLTGTGGGIFLSPIMIFGRWVEVRKASGTAVSFILINSTAALLGNVKAVGSLPEALPIFASAVIAGALVGTRLGISGFATPMILRALGVVLLVAAGKLLLS